MIFRFSAMRYFLFLFLIGVLTGCSDGLLGIGSGEVEAKVNEKELEVHNNLNGSIYYFAVERGTAAVISWAPLSEERNEVKARHTRKISLDDIIGYKKGKEILFYYWAQKEPGSDDIKNMVIQTDKN